jgi:tetratricopeptide (TPR) repeat protein
VADNQRIEDLRRRVQRDPASIAFAQLAEECRRAGHFQEAVDVCRAGLELHPGYLSARVTLGRALIELNDLDIALAELEHVLKSAPENLAAIRGIAEIHHRKGVLPEALAYYRAALALAHNDPDLQRTVNELALQVEPPPRPASADGLSFAQMQDELLQNFLLAPPPAKAPAVVPVVDDAPAQAFEAGTEPDPAAALPDPATGLAVESSAAPVAAPDPTAPVFASEPTVAEAAAERRADGNQAERVITALERWVEAIHVVRAQPRT